ncbi:MAG: endonuclease III [Campylobacterales bacterium]|nr:endonuclease III [Campylobacterales bacterium]
MTNTEILKGLRHHYPKPYTDLDYTNNFELLIAIILSAQTTDKKVNEITKTLFKNYPAPLDLMGADLEEVEKILQPLGMQKQKSKSITNCAKTLVEQFDSKIPDTLEDLTKLAGVGRKTASAVLVKGFNKPAIVVDTHAKRVSQRLDITKQETPEKVEIDLKKFFHEEDWCYISQVIVLFGRYICMAKKPNCQECFFIQSCKSAII